MDVSFALTFDGQCAAELREAGARVTILEEARLSRPISVWRARRALSRLLRQERPDVVVCHQAWPVVMFGSTVKAAKVPLVMWLHMSVTRHWLNRMAWRVGPDAIICNSRYTASTLPSVDAPVDVAYAPMSPAVAPAAHEAAKTELVIIQVSRMERLKGHAVLLEALARLRGRAGWSCWIVGGAQRPNEESYAASLRARVADLGIADRVKFLGHRLDARELMRNADICCQPNVEPDAFGLTLIEALSAGVPVVASAIGGAIEIVDSTCGVLVAPADPETLAHELNGLLDDRARRAYLGANGPQRAKTLCDPAAQMPRIAGILERVAAGAAS